MIGKIQKIILGVIVAIIILVEATTVGLYLKEQHTNKILNENLDELTAENDSLYKTNEELSDMLKQASAVQAEPVETKELKGEPKLILSDKLGSLKFDLGTDIKKAKSGITAEAKSLKTNPVIEMDNNKYGTKITSLGIDDVLTISDADGVMHQYKITKGEQTDKKPEAKDDELVLFTKTSSNYYVIYAKKTF